jgi:hypothetical protein
LIFGVLRRVGKEMRFYLVALDGVDTTFDTTQRATPRNSWRPSANKTAYLSGFSNIGQHRETGVSG